MADNENLNWLNSLLGRDNLTEAQFNQIIKWIRGEGVLGPPAYRKLRQAGYVVGPKTRKKLTDKERAAQATWTDKGEKEVRDELAKKLDIKPVEQPPVEQAPADEPATKPATPPQLKPSPRVNEKGLPPVPEGFTRLYRGDVIDPDTGQPYEMEMKVSGRGDTQHRGNWWSSSPSKPRAFATSENMPVVPEGKKSSARYRYIDIPSDEVEQYLSINVDPKLRRRYERGARQYGDEYLVPPEITADAKEIDLVVNEQALNKAINDIIMSPSAYGFFQALYANLDDIAGGRVIMTDAKTMGYTTDDVRADLLAALDLLQDPEANFERLRSILQKPYFTRDIAETLGVADKVFDYAPAATAAPESTFVPDTESTFVPDPVQETPAVEQTPSIESSVAQFAARIAGLMALVNSGELDPVDAMDREIQIKAEAEKAGVSGDDIDEMLADPDFDPTTVLNTAPKSAESTFVPDPVQESTFVPDPVQESQTESSTPAVDPTDLVQVAAVARGLTQAQIKLLKGLASGDVSNYNANTLKALRNRGLVSDTTPITFTPLGAQVVESFGVKVQSKGLDVTPSVRTERQERRDAKRDEEYEPRPQQNQSVFRPESAGEASNRELKATQDMAARERASEFFDNVLVNGEIPQPTEYDEKTIAARASRLHWESLSDEEKQPWVEQAAEAGGNAQSLAWKNLAKTKQEPWQEAALKSLQEKEGVKVVLSEDAVTRYALENNIPVNQAEAELAAEVARRADEAGKAAVLPDAGTNENPQPLPTTLPYGGPARERSYAAGVSNVGGTVEAKRQDDIEKARRNPTAETRTPLNAKATAAGVIEGLIPPAPEQTGADPEAVAAAQAKLASQGEPVPASNISEYLDDLGTYSVNGMVLTPWVAYFFEQYGTPEDAVRSNTFGEYERQLERIEASTPMLPEEAQWIAGQIRQARQRQATRTVGQKAPAAEPRPPSSEIIANALKQGIYSYPADTFEGKILRSSMEDIEALIPQVQNIVAADPSQRGLLDVVDEAIALRLADERRNLDALWMEGLLGPREYDQRAATLVRMSVSGRGVITPQFGVSDALSQYYATRATPEEAQGGATLGETLVPQQQPNVPLSRTPVTSTGAPWIGGVAPLGTPPIREAAPRQRQLEDLDVPPLGLLSGPASAFPSNPPPLVRVPGIVVPPAPGASIGGKGAGEGIYVPQQGAPFPPTPLAVVAAAAGGDRLGFGDRLSATERQAEAAAKAAVENARRHVQNIGAPTEGPLVPGTNEIPVRTGPPPRALPPGPVPRAALLPGSEPVDLLAGVRQPEPVLAGAGAPPPGAAVGGAAGGGAPLGGAGAPPPSNNVFAAGPTGSTGSQLVSGVGAVDDLAPSGGVFGRPVFGGGQVPGTTPVPLTAGPPVPRSGPPLALPAGSVDPLAGFAGVSDEPLGGGGAGGAGGGGLGGGRGGGGFGGGGGGGGVPPSGPPGPGGPTGPSGGRSFGQQLVRYDEAFANMQRGIYPKPAGYSRWWEFAGPRSAEAAARRASMFGEAVGPLRGALRGSYAGPAIPLSLAGMGAGFIGNRINTPYTIDEEGPDVTDVGQALQSVEPVLGLGAPAAGALIGAGIVSGPVGWGLLAAGTIGAAIYGATRGKKTPNQKIEAVADRLNVDSKLRDTYLGVLDSLRESGASDEEVQTYTQQFIDQMTRDKLSQASTGGAAATPQLSAEQQMAMQRRYFETIQAINAEANRYTDLAYGQLGLNPNAMASTYAGTSNEGLANVLSASRAAQASYGAALANQALATPFGDYYKYLNEQQMARAGGGYGSAATSQADLLNLLNQQTGYTSMAGTTGG